MQYKQALSVGLFVCLLGGAAKAEDANLSGRLAIQDKILRYSQYHRGEHEEVTRGFRSTDWNQCSHFDIIVKKIAPNVWDFFQIDAVCTLSYKLPHVRDRQLPVTIRGRVRLYVRIADGKVTGTDVPRLATSDEWVDPTPQSLQATADSLIKMAADQLHEIK
ncbi:MAG: hypothetical protein AAB421_01855 [Patescibacteria group bacterium]